MSKITIVIADDHSYLREGVKTALDNVPDCNVIGEAENGEQTIKIVNQLQPDVLILDIEMSDMNGIDVAQELSESLPNLKIIMLSMHSLPVYFLAALQAGAVGYVLKGSDRKHLIQAIRAAMNEQIYLALELGKLQDYMQKNWLQNKLPKENLVALNLTEREKQILDCILSGLSNSEIANLLKISSGTVKKHRSNLMLKMGVHNIGELFHFAISNDLMPNKD